MPLRARLLGFAFANADLLFEIERSGEVLFATGAQRDLADGVPLTGRNVETLFEPREAARLMGHVRNLGDGGRHGPMRLKLVGGRDVDVALCRLPQNDGRVSCTLSYAGDRMSFAAGAGRDEQTGLADAETFLKAAQAAGEEGNLAVVDVKALAEMPQDDAAAILARIGEAVGRAGFKVAGRVSETRFGAVAEEGQSLGDVVRSALHEGGLGTLPVEETLVSLKGRGLSGEQRMLALRYALKQVTLKPGQTPADLTRTFETVVRETEARALKLSATVSDGAFALAFQPIVRLKTGAVAHYEVLSRFENANTQEVIEFGEQLGISDAFDVAVAIKTFAAMEKLGDRCPSVAINVSGHTLSNSTSFGLLAGLLAKRRRYADSMLIEITETAAVTDLASANKAIQSLREMGYHVGLDDFGAGAASFQYLHAFNVDFVKIDGSLIKKIGESERDDLLLKSIIALCDQLKIETIAEYVTDEASFRRVRDMGFTMGQGFHFARASSDLPPTPTARRAQRR